jgi:DNA-binding MarR family transcriptional regulator
MSFLLKNAQQVLLSAEEIIRRFRELVNRALHDGQCEISYDQWLVLKVLVTDQGLSQIDLSKLTKKEPASISRILKLLEEKDLIQRISDKKNKRTKRIYISIKGKENHQKAQRIFNIIAKKAFEGVYDQELNLFVRILDKIEDNFEKLDPGN